MAASSNMSTLDVSNALNRLTVDETRELFFQLKVPLNVLDDIASQFNGKNRKQHFVQKWLDMNTDASWDTLVAGLRQMNMNTLATDIESAHRLRVPNSGSVSHVLTSTHSVPLEVCTPVQLETASATMYATQAIPPTPPSLSSSLSSSSQPTASFPQRVQVASASIECLEEEFSNIKFDAQESLSERESKDKKFVRRFREHLLDLPVTKKQAHIRFFVRNEEEILAADTIEKLFIILRRHCNYTNYEIIFHIIKRFCKELNQRMLNYRDSLTVFEKVTTVDVYLNVISARPDGAISAGFIKMTMKMNKPSSECTLHDIRKLKESIEEQACLESYVMYIESPGEGSVCVGMCVHERVGWMVGVVLTPDFKQKHLLSEVTVKKSWWRNGKSLAQYLSIVLREVSRGGDVETVNALISAGADVNDVDGWGDSALMETTRWGEIEVASLLVKAGSVLDLQNRNEDSALMLAALTGRTEVVSLLLKAGAALDLQDKWGNSALMKAGWRGETEVVSLLVKAGAALDLQDKRGDSAVIMATTHYHLPVLNELVRAGADLNLQNEEGLTALMISSRSGRTELTKTLLSGQNISVDLQTITGWSALFFAAEVGDVDTVDLLIKAGANPHLTDQNGLSAEAVAAASDRREVYQLLSGRHTKELSLPLATTISQGVREAVKNTGSWAKQAFLRLEVRFLRPDKGKTQLDPGVRCQEGEEGVRGRIRSDLPPEQMREEYLSRLSQH